jgi:hypothetical protein
MISLYLVGDGPRDGTTVPPLLERLMGREVEVIENHWARLNSPRGGGGSDRKLRFAIRQAIDAGADGLVAVVDRDKEPNHDRLKRLKQGRDEDRQSLPPFPTALGEAVPHGEAWLLDDPVAIRGALQLPNEVPIVSVRRTKDPKGEIAGLIEVSPRRDEGTLDLLREIANAVVRSRCQHDKETGFHDFDEEVRGEFRDLIGA